MKATIITSLLLGVSGAIAVPSAITSSYGTSGAAYFLTNDPTGNYIVSGDIASDGHLTLRNAFCTEGTGGHGISAGSTMTPDALFSQGAVRVSQAHKFLVTVNPGSNTIAAFHIDPWAPSNLKLLGSPVESGGEFPISVAINNAGDLVCALNGGAVNGIKCFKMDLTTGLTPLENSTRILSVNQTTPPVGPPNTLGDIQFSEDSTKLFASVKGDPATATVGFLAAWDFAHDYSLSADFTAVAPASGGLLPFGITVIPGKEALLVADPAVGFDVFDISNTKRNASSVVPVEGQTSICWSVRSPKTGNYYLSDTAGGAMFEVAVDDSLKGSLVRRYPQQVASAPTDLDVAVIGDQNYLYILQPNATQIAVISLPEAGKAQTIQEVDIAAFAASMDLTLASYNLQGMATYVV